MYYHVLHTFGPFRSGRLIRVYRDENLEVGKHLLGMGPLWKDWEETGKTRVSKSPNNLGE